MHYVAINPIRKAECWPVPSFQNTNFVCSTVRNSGRPTRPTDSGSKGDETLIQLNPPRYWLYAILRTVKPCYWATRSTAANAVESIAR